MKVEQKNYMVLLEGEQKGPFSPIEVQAMIAEGVLVASDLVRKNGVDEWLPISEISDLAAQPESSDASHVTENLAGNQSNITITEKLQTSAKLAAAQAKLEKLKRIDLSAELTGLGTLAYETVADWPDLQSQYKAIDEIKNQIQFLGKTPAIDENSGMAEKAKHQVKKTRQAVEIERLLHKKKRLLRKIGEDVAAMHEVPPGLQQCLARVHEVQSRIVDVSNEIDSLRSSVSGVFAKPVKALAVLGVVLLVLFIWKFAAPGNEKLSVDQQIKNQQKISQAQADVQRAELAVRYQEIQREILERKERLEEEQKIAAAERQRIEKEKQKQYEVEQQKFQQGLEEARKMTAAEMQRVNQESQQRYEAEQRRQQEEQKNMIEAERLAAEERRAQEERRRQEEEVAQKERWAQEKKEAQEERKALAARLFSAIRLSPEVRLSRGLQKTVSAIEMRGKNFDLLRELQKKEDWLGLLVALNGKPMDEYPAEYTIQSNFTNLKNYSGFRVLIKTQFSVTNTHRIFLIRPINFSSISNAYPMSDYAYISHHWERHPDGIGWLHEWNPTDEIGVFEPDFFVTVANPTAITSYMKKTKDIYNKERVLLRKKYELGELTKEEFDANVRALTQRLYQELIQWAEEQ